MTKINPKDWRFCSQRQRMSPFPNYMSMEAMCSRAKNFVGVNAPHILLLNEDRICTIFIPKKEFSATVEKVMKRIHGDHKLFFNLVQKQHIVGKRLVHFAKQSFRTNLSTVSNSKLAGLYATYEDYYKDVYACYGHVWIIEDALNKELLDIVQKRIPDFAPTSLKLRRASKTSVDFIKATDILNTLTLQPGAMVARIEREALFELAAKIVKNKKWKGQVLKSGVEGHDKHLAKLIKKHEQDYFWVTRDYDDPVLTYHTITEKLREAIKKNPEKVYKRMVAERLSIHTKQQQLRKQLKLTKKEIGLFNTMLDVAYLKELRKRYVSESLYYFDKVLLEIGTRLFLSLKQVRFLSTKDVKDGLTRKKDVTSVVNARIKQAAWLTNGKRTQIFTGKESNAYHKALVGYSVNTTEFTGMAVSPGIARGPVRIIMNPNEIHKVKKGDIIVSIQVVPSFAPAVLRSAGLICDGGHGITTHPAIIAREAGVPCIIQTRFARHVLKDGDMVEVDGYKGIARKL